MPISMNQTEAEAATGMKNADRPRTQFRVEINPRLCKGCYFCIRYCPMGVFSSSGEIGELGYVIAKVEHPEKCTGCRLCLIYCPDFATSVEEKRSGSN
jgi:2-oxoglutarate ferredoxin oxidoreductase subunit delta